MNERIKSVDILRAFAIIFMIPYHIYIHWPSQNKDLFSYIIIMLGNLPGPIFTIISGTSFFFFINKKNNGINFKKNIFYEILKRALFIFIFSTILQYLFGFLLGNKINFFIYWSLFQLISISMIIFFFIPFLKKEIRYISYLCINFLIFFAYYIICLNQIRILSILVYDGIFPFLPWASFFVFGLFLGDLLINYFESFDKRIFYIFLLIGVICFITSIISWNLIEINYFSLFLLGYGVFFILFSIFYYLLEIKKKDNFLIKHLIQWGKFSFSIYYIHYAAIILGILIFPLIISDLYSNGFLINHYIFFFIVFFVSIDLFLIIWKRFNYILGVEWLINLISKKSMFLSE